MNISTVFLRGSCEETTRLMSDHADAELRGFRRWRVARHLSACVRCRAVFQGLLATIGMVGRLRADEPEPRPELGEEVAGRIRAEGTAQ